MRPPVDKMEFGNNLKRLRERAELSQGDLAVLVNKAAGTAYNRGTVSKWENGSFPSVGLLPLLSDILSIPIIYFFNFEDSKDGVINTAEELGSQVEAIKISRNSNPDEENKKLWVVIDHLSKLLKDKTAECDNLKEVNQNAIDLLTKRNV